jgi:aspartate aminotransferase
VLDEVASVLATAVGRNSYGTVVGSDQARVAAAGWFTRRGLPTGADQIIFAPGSKALLFALLATLPGDLILPAPAWVSYAAQAAIAGKRVIGVPIPPEAGGIPDPERLERALLESRAAGGNPGLLMLTVPDNPTGTIARPEQVAAVCAIAERYGLTVISDEIYAELSHDGRPTPSATAYLPQRTVVTNGLSKSLALGGWRVGFARVPAGEWGRDLLRNVVGMASEVWSSLAAPMQEVAAYVLADPPEVTARIAASRRLHAVVARAVHAEFVDAGADCRPPEAGFYLYPDFEPVRGILARHGARTGAELVSTLLERHGVGVLPGAAFGDDPHGLRVRVATSLLYGESTPERLAALSSADPLALPWIGACVAQLHDALAALTRPA